MTPVTTHHIEVDEQGVAWITDTNTKVVEVVLDRLAHGWSPEEIHFQHPSLPLAKIHAALSYYYDHQDELDAEIVRREQDVNRLASQSSSTPLQRKHLERKISQ